MKQKFILKKSKYGGYWPAPKQKDIGNLETLADFLCDLGSIVGQTLIIEWLLDPKFEGTAGNTTYFEKSDNNTHINYELSPPNPPDFIIKTQNLIEIIKKWFELTEKKVNTITLIEENDGTITIQ